MTEQRAEFVALAQQPGANRRALCRAFQIAPPTGYKWLRRYAAEGPAGLQDRSRRPRRSPARTAPAIERAVLALRAQHPTWGSRKLRVLLARQGIQPLPAASTITAILRRHDQLDPTQGAGQPRAWQRFEHPYPNALWQMDFKAGWPCGAGRCHPLTILDDHSRYALGLAACPNQRTATVRPHLITAFQRYGLPDRLLVDNGSPWGNHPAHPYTPLTVWLRRLGIAVSHSRPYHPQTLGKDERFHGTLERDLGRQPRGLIWSPGKPPSMPGARSTTRCGPTRRWPWRCPPVAITSALDPNPLSCRRCPAPRPPSSPPSPTWRVSAAGAAPGAASPLSPASVPSSPTAGSPPSSSAGPPPTADCCAAKRPANRFASPAARSAPARSWTRTAYRSRPERWPAVSTAASTATRRSGRPTPPAPSATRLPTTSSTG